MQYTLMEIVEKTGISEETIIKWYKQTQSKVTVQKENMEDILDEQGKIIPCRIHKGGSIGPHKHETSDDVQVCNLIRIILDFAFKIKYYSDRRFNNT